jgi:hypothetical protein
MAGKVCQREESGPAQVRERSPVWVLLRQIWARAFEVSRMTRWNNRSALGLVDRQVSWGVSGRVLRVTARVGAAWTVA